MKSSSIHLLLLVVACLAFQPAFAVDDDESPLKAAPKPDYHQADKLGSQLDDVSMNNDIEAADAVAYKGVENDANVEAAGLRKDIARLEKEIAATKAGIGQAKQSAELAQKKTDLVRADNAWARRRLAKTNAAKDAAEKEHQIEEQKLQAVQAEAKSIAEENHKIEVFIQMNRDDRAKIMARATALRAQIAQMKARQQTLIEKNKLMKQQNKEMDQKVTSAEGRMGGSAPGRATASAPASNP